MAVEDGNCIEWWRQWITARWWLDDGEVDNDGCGGGKDGDRTAAMTTTTAAAVAAMTTTTTAMAVATMTAAGTDNNQLKVAAEEATVAEATVAIDGGSNDS